MWCIEETRYGNGTLYPIINFLSSQHQQQDKRKSTINLLRGVNLHKKIHGFMHDFFHSIHLFLILLRFTLKKYAKIYFNHFESFCMRELYGLTHTNISAMYA